jgi:hypothetical protein
MAFLKVRNSELNPRFDGIATQYMRFGEELGLRWDIAFFQMVLETGQLSFTGDVRASQNNFAGLGATGNGVRGESFKDVETGVRAHLEHIRLYAGRPVENPVAERTRKVHEWRILESWQRSFKRPMTYSDIVAKWAPGSRGYAYQVQQLAEEFHSTLCRQPDPRPELVHEARALVLATTGRASPTGKAQAAEASAEAPPLVHPSGEDLAKRAIAQAKEDGTDKRSSLGVQTPPEATAPTSTSPAAFKLAGAAPSAGKTTRTAAADTAAPPTENAVPFVSKSGAEKSAGKTAEKSAGSRLALATAGTAGAKSKMLPDTALPPSANQRCRVWTASYGGQKALIIRSVTDQVVNFTVLDVNDGSERREAEAFIAAYAKNGKIAGEYANQAQALDKAFELCPEG